MKRVRVAVGQEKGVGTRGAKPPQPFCNGRFRRAFAKGCFDYSSPSKRLRFFVLEGGGPSLSQGLVVYEAWALQPGAGAWDTRVTIMRYLGFSRGLEKKESCVTHALLMRYSCVTSANIRDSRKGCARQAKKKNLD